MAALTPLQRRAAASFNNNLAQVGISPPAASPFLDMLLKLLAGCMANNATPADIKKTCLDCYNEEGSRGDNRRTRAILRHGLKKVHGRKAYSGDELDQAVDALLAAGAKADDAEFTELCESVPAEMRASATRSLGDVEEVVAPAKGGK